MLHWYRIFHVISILPLFDVCRNTSQNSMASYIPASTKLKGINCSILSTGPPVCPSVEKKTCPLCILCIQNDNIYISYQPTSECVSHVDFLNSRIWMFAFILPQAVGPSIYDWPMTQPLCQWSAILALTLALNFKAKLWTSCVWRMAGFDLFGFVIIKAVNSGMGKYEWYMYIFHQAGGILDYYIVSLM